MTRRRRTRLVLVAHALVVCVVVAVRAESWAGQGQAGAPRPGDGQSDEATSLLAKAIALLERGQPQVALPLAERALLLREQAHAPELDLAAALDTTGRLQELTGDYKKALTTLQRGLEIRERVRGGDHPDTAASLRNVAALQANLGDFAQSEALHRRALGIRERALGAQHRDVANSLLGLGTLFYQKGDFPQSETFFARAVTILEAATGPDSWQVASAVSGLARTFMARAEFVRAESLFARALAIQERTLDAASPVLAATIGNLAVLHIQLGNLTTAESLFERSLPITAAALGPEHRNIGLTLLNLAVIADRRRDYAKAEPLYSRAIALWEKTLGPEHNEVANGLNNLAGLLQRKGDYLKAEPLYRRALSIREKAYGPVHADVGASLSSLGGLLALLGRSGEAESLYRRALEIQEQTLGPDHPRLALILNNLATLAADTRDYAQAEALIRRALTIQEQKLGADNADVGQTLNAMGRLYLRKGDTAAAEPILQRALSIGEAAVGVTHPDVATSLNGLAEVHRTQGDVAGAIDYLSRHHDIRERNFERDLPVGSERQKLSFLDLFAEDVDAALSLHLQSAPDNFAARRLAMTTILRRKGRAIDAASNSVAALRARAQPADQALFSRLTDARSQLASVMLRGPGDNAASTRSRRAAAEGQVDQLEAEIGSRSAEFRAQSMPISMASVQARIPPGAALIEFALYRPTRGGVDGGTELRVAAYVLTASGALTSADLGDAEAIERAVDAWRQALRDPARRDVTRLARALDARLMEPVRPLLGSTAHLLISPDGPLNLIPFAALVDENGRHLVDRYLISYLTSGRDLLRLETARSSRSAAVIVADPLFGEPSLVAERRSPDGAAAGRVDDSQIFFGPLPGVRDELRVLTGLIPQANVLTREQATKAALQRVTAPRILHIATHGFFLGDASGETSPTQAAGEQRLGRWVARVESPLLRSGLALAGANHTAGGDARGILTALEAASLDLWGTKLVVLSACDTGVGQVKNGDGVYGLRRALVLAGSESQLMSLWPVSDRSTRDLMIGYYTRLTKGGGRGDSLRQTQLAMLRDQRHHHPYYWASFIQSGAWTSLDGQP